MNVTEREQVVELNSAAQFFGKTSAATRQWLTSRIDDLTECPEDEDLDPDRLAGCAYWRCGEIFERCNTNHRYCRKACRSRQKKWERAQQRRATDGLRDRTS